MLNVVQLSSGINHMLLAYIDRHLAEAGHDSELVVPWPEKLLGDAVRRIEDHDWVRRPGAETSEALARLCSRVGADVILVHQPQQLPALDSLVRAVSAGDLPPVVGFVHTAICPGGKLFRRAETVCTVKLGASCVTHWYTGPCGPTRSPITAVRKVSASLAARDQLLDLPNVLVGSRWMVRYLEHDGLAMERIVPVDLPSLLPQVASQGPGHLPPGPPHIVLFVGRLVVGKGVDHLFEVMSMLPRDDVRLVIVGDGYYRGSLERRARDLGLDSRVEFVGWVSFDRLGRWYSEAAVLVVPSLLPETLGLVVWEAATYGCPAIVSDRGALPEWEELLPETQVCDVQDATAWADAIERAIGAPRMSSARRGHVTVRKTVAAALEGVVNGSRQV